MIFEQPKHLNEVQYRKNIRVLGYALILIFLGNLFLASIIVRFEAGAGHPVRIKPLISLPLVHLLWWVAVRTLLWFQARSRRFLEIRDDRIFLSSKGEYPIQAVTEWSLTPDRLDPAFSVLRISVS